MNVPRLGPISTLMVTAILAVVALRYRLFESSFPVLATLYALAVALLTVVGYLLAFRLLPGSSGVLLLAVVGITLLVVATTRQLVAADDGQSTDLKTKLQQTERDAVLAALERANQNRSLAARILGVSRRTLYNKIEELGLSFR